ncbi:MAG: molybdenum cofactor biosynthesis protein MoaE, partial [Planctomycetes bacterium]|nr:molybdenum cofactor biosynthesis protein MoaE [Planctomycetota bacterium]
AVVVFCGDVRSRRDERVVVQLEYESYEAMLGRELESIAHQASQGRSILRIALVHAVGVVPAGECSIQVAVASAHRKQAFECAVALMGGLKSTAPIWKKELYEDGSEWRGQGS